MQWNDKSLQIYQKLTSSIFQISWIRHADLHILTVGRYTYTADNRYQSIYNPTTDEWILQVTQNRVKEPGVKCTDTLVDKVPAKARQWDVRMPGFNAACQKFFRSA